MISCTQESACMETIAPPYGSARLASKLCNNLKHDLVMHWILYWPQGHDTIYQSAMTNRRRQHATGLPLRTKEAKSENETKMIKSNTELLRKQKLLWQQGHTIEL